MLRQIRFEEDKYARMIGLPQFGGANVVLDPSITAHNGPLALSEYAWSWTWSSWALYGPAVFTSTRMG
jgi:hypothetical protein